MYVSVVDGPALRHLDIIDAHEAFVDALEHAAIDHTVLRPTGYFSDMGELFEMARKGRVYLFGSGTHRTNPIHGADLAVRCADAIDSRDTEIVVGGPDTLTWQEIAEAAFEAQGKAPKISRVPRWVMSTAIGLTRVFSRHNAGLLAFFTTMGTQDIVAPPTGTHRLIDHFRHLEAER